MVLAHYVLKEELALYEEPAEPLPSLVVEFEDVDEILPFVLNLLDLELIVYSVNQQIDVGLVLLEQELVGNLI